MTRKVKVTVRHDCLVDELRTQFIYALCEQEEDDDYVDISLRIIFKKNTVVFSNLYYKLTEYNVQDHDIIDAFDY